MNGPNTMYKMRPIIKLAEDIDLPKCMYKMKIIQNSHCVIQNERIGSDKCASVNSDQQPMPEVIALENRQEEILAQLAQLKQQLNTLREQLKKPPVCKTYTSLEIPDSSKSGFPEEIVVKVNPKWPPYSLLAFNNLLQNSINIYSYVHSTVKSESEIAQCFQRASHSPVFNIRLIWKDVPETEFLISPTKHTVISTEVNLLRFLSRLGPSELNYEVSGDPVAITVADIILDSCYELKNATTHRARQVHVKALGASLKNHQFLMGDNVSIVDVAGWSILKQLGYKSKDLPVSINNWLERCNEKFGVNGTLNQ